ncbi:hypothetical protein BDV95DRAFT_561315 [Massariosphaeria phaeospora]|uniref:Uncharacterized protein n=1 Tax=Massariosphaeria phaeospora TaxID=100035 RepID=A0A7C8IHS1_9PLEO|nr:hypothetical protein BDV95DRAFT_561315 [Massariosphaeria phaeospora]
MLRTQWRLGRRRVVRCVGAVGPCVLVVRRGVVAPRELEVHVSLVGVLVSSWYLVLSSRRMGVLPVDPVFVVLFAGTHRAWMVVHGQRGAIRVVGRGVWSIGLFLLLLLLVPCSRIRLLVVPRIVQRRPVMRCVCGFVWVCVCLCMCMYMCVPPHHYHSLLPAAV